MLRAGVSNQRSVAPTLSDCQVDKTGYLRAPRQHLSELMRRAISVLKSFVSFDTRIEATWWLRDPNTKEYLCCERYVPLSTVYIDWDKYSTRRLVFVLPLFMYERALSRFSVTADSSVILNNILAWMNVLIVS